MLIKLFEKPIVPPRPGKRGAGFNCDVTSIISAYEIPYIFKKQKQLFSKSLSGDSDAPSKDAKHLTI